MTLYVPQTDGSACKVAELHDTRASLRVVFFAFQVNVDYGYVCANRTCFLCFLHHLRDSVKILR